MSTNETTYETLYGALTDIAGRSFHESADVFRNDDGSWAVRDAPSMADDSVMWTYENGLEAGTGAYDYSRLHESYESYDSAGHIRYNLSQAVSALENEGKSVHFTYVVVDGYPSTPEDIEDDENGIYDAVVGWALIAYVI